MKKLLTIVLVSLLAGCQGTPLTAETGAAEQQVEPTAPQAPAAPPVVIDESHPSDPSDPVELRDRLASIKLQLDAVDRSHDETAELASKVFELSQTLRQK